MKILRILVLLHVLTFCTPKNNQSKKEENPYPNPDRRDTFPKRNNDTFPKRNNDPPIKVPNDMFIIDEATKKIKGIDTKSDEYIKFVKDIYQYYKDNSDSIIDDFEKDPTKALDKWFPKTDNTYSQYIYSQKFLFGLQNNDRFKKFCKDMKKEYKEINKGNSNPELTKKQQAMKQWFKNKNILPPKEFMKYLEPQSYQKMVNKVYYGGEHKRDKNWKNKSEEEKNKIINEEVKKEMNDSLLFAGVLNSKTSEVEISKNLKKSFEEGIKDFKEKDGLWIIGCCDYCGEWIYIYKSKYFNDRWHFDQNYLGGRFYTNMKCENPTCLAYKKASQTDHIKYFLKGHIFNIQCKLGDKDVLKKQINALETVKLFTPTKEIDFHFKDKDPQNLFVNAYDALDRVNKECLKIIITSVDSKEKHKKT